MRTFFEIAGVLLGVLLFVGLMGWGIVWVVSNAPKPHIPVCIKWEDHYYWVGWGGGHHNVGTDLEMARKLAGDRPLTTLPKCVEYN